MLIAIIGSIMSAVGFGTANIVIKKYTEKLTLGQTLLNSMLAGVVILAIWTLLSGLPGDFSGSYLEKFLILGIGDACLYLFLYKTLRVSNVTIASTIMSVYPILSTFYAVLVLSEQVSVVTFVVIVLIVISAILVGIDWENVIKDGFDKGDLTKGIGWIAITTLLHALYFPALSDYMGSGDWGFKLLGVKVVALLLLGVFFLRREKRIPLLYHRAAKVWPLVLLGLLETFGWIGLSWASESTEGMTSIIVALGSAAPIVTAVLAFFVLKEKLKPLQYLGIVIMMASIMALAVI